MLPALIRSNIEQIAADNVHGASVLTSEAAGMFALLAEEDVPEEGLHGLLVEASLALIAAQPSMASIFRLANDALLAAEASQGPSELRMRLTRFSEEARVRMERVAARVAQQGAELVQDGAVVMTHSHSTAVERALCQARKKGKRFRVLAAESRPLREGLALARSLARAGIPIALFADAAVYRMMPEATVVMVGADAVSSQGLVNKIGTAPAALAARELGKPLFAICGSDKFLGPRMRTVAERTRAARELLPETPPGVAALNYYFDTTPLSLVSGVVTEDGVLSGDGLAGRLSQLRAHPALLKLQDQMS